jgi:hypothetical protein
VTDPENITAKFYGDLFRMLASGHAAGTTATELLEANDEREAEERSRFAAFNAALAAKETL